MNPASSPFKFLDAYTREDREIFFGRDREIEELYQKVFESKVLLLYGISGTGKTSLINCGLANKFEDSDWLPVNIRRGMDINKNLDFELHKAALTSLKQSTGFVGAIQSIYLDHFKPIYLIFDQFEELFIFGDRQERDEFIRRIKELIDSDVQCRIIFSIREEYLAGVTEFESVIPDFLSNRMRVEKMTRQHAIEVIEGPCKVHNIEVEEGFAEALLYKLNPDTNEIELTYLQVFLDKIYRLSGDSKKFGFELFEKAGDVSDLLGSFLEEQINELEDPDTGLVVLKAFVSMQGTKKQIGEEEILEFSRTLGKPLEGTILTDLLQKFVNLRLLRDKDENGRYELRHDSLATKIFEKITLVEKDLLEIKVFIENAYHNYERRGVYLGREDLKYIAPYEDKLFLRKQLEVFIQDSKRLIEKERRRKRSIVAMAAIALLVIFAGFTVWALSERRQAIQQKNEAITAKDEANESRLLAENSRKEAEDAKDDALRQKELADSVSNVAIKERNMAQYQRKEADMQRQRAETLFEESNEQRGIAEEAQKQAEESASEVLEANRNAMFQLYLFNANELANKSLLMKRDDTLKVLLALTAKDLFDYGYAHYSDCTSTDLYDLAVVEALQKAYIKFDPGIILEGEIWVLDLKHEYLAYSEELNKVTMLKMDHQPLKPPDFIFIDDFYLEYTIKEEKIVYPKNKSTIRSIRIVNKGKKVISTTLPGDVYSINKDSNLEFHSINKIFNNASQVNLFTHLKVTDILLTLSLDNSLQVWDLNDYYLLGEFHISEIISDIVLLDSSKFILKGSKSIYFLDLSAIDYDLKEIYNYPFEIQVLAYNPKSGKLATYSHGDGLSVFKLSVDSTCSLTFIDKYQLPESGDIFCMEFNPEGNWLAMGSLDGTILLWDLSDERINSLGTLSPILYKSQNGRIVSMKFDSSGKYLIYSDLKTISMYPVSYDDLYHKLENIIQDMGLQEEDWKAFTRGNIVNPRHKN